jgi:hypothetical protein
MVQVSVGALVASPDEVPALLARLTTRFDHYREEG